jgi:uncharacterized protein YkwD
MRTSNHFFFTALTALAMAGCGGGSSDSASTGPVGTNPAPSPVPVIPTPTPLDPVTPVVPTPTPQSASLQAPAATTYGASTATQFVFDQLNAFRAGQGLGPLNQNANADIAAKNHAAYVTTHHSGATPHDEVAGKAGFTGVTVQERLIAAGYPAVAATEVIAFSMQFPSRENTAIENLINSVYHRSALMFQGMTTMGIAPETHDSPLHVAIGTSKYREQFNAGTYVGIFPTNNQTGIWLTHGVESPNPFYLEMEMTQANMCAKTSSPMSVVSEASTNLEVTSFTVTEEGQATPLDARLITKATSAQDNTYLPANVAFLVGKASFKPSTKYNVRFVGKATGTVTGGTSGFAFEKVWSFTTGTYKRSC